MAGLIVCVLFVGVAVQLRNEGAYPPSELPGLNSYFEAFGVVGVIFGVILVLGMVGDRK